MPSYDLVDDMTHVVKNDGSGWNVCLRRVVRAAEPGDTVVVPSVAMAAFGKRWMVLRKITGITLITDKGSYVRAFSP